MANAKNQRPQAVEPTSYYTVKIAYDGTNPEYIGKAPTGTATSTASWSIKKITWDGNNNPTDIKWASGTETYDKVWDNRASYSYS